MRRSVSGKAIVRVLNALSLDVSESLWTMKKRLQYSGFSLLLELTWLHNLRKLIYISSAPSLEDRME